MDHVDADALALAALGETLAAPDEAHLAVCERCADEVASLARAARIARESRPDDLVAPPPRVWARIGAELGLAGSTPAPAVRLSVTRTDPVADEPVEVAARPAPVPAPEAAPSGGDEAHDEDDDDTVPVATIPEADLRPTAPVVPLRRRPPVWVAAAAAAGVVVGGAGATWFANRDVAATVVAQARLDALPGWDAAGRAEVEVDEDGRRELVLTVDATEVDGFREVWLLNEDVTGLVSLGVLEGGTGRFLLPEDLDLLEYPVVDVSAEPIDGDPAHSGDSIVRGVLDGGSLGA